MIDIDRVNGTMAALETLRTKARALLDDGKRAAAADEPDAERKLIRAAMLFSWLEGATDELVRRLDRETETVRNREPGP